MRVHQIVAGLLVVGFCAELPVRAQEQFNHGDIFITLAQGKGCRYGGEEMILRIDPATWEGSAFAIFGDGLCNASGLRFHPDAQRLFVMNGTLAPLGGPLGGGIISFAPNGESEILYDGDDGLSDLFGSNGVAFDTDENLYVVSASGILRFPVDGGPATVFASNGISSRGALDFAPNGDLFHGSHGADAVIRITPDGEVSVFDPLTVATSLVFDRMGNLFVVAGPTVFRYDAGDPDARRVLASGFGAIHGGGNTLTFSPDESSLYMAAFVDQSVYAIDPENGATELVFDLAAWGPGPEPRGLAVYVDPCVFIQGITPECDGNEIPAQCGDCVANCECDDGEICTFDRCTDNACSNIAALFGDTVGDSGTCGPDGVVGLGDILAVLDGFQGAFAEGCARHNIDITGDTHCVSDGTIDLHDILAVLNAFSGTGDCVCDP